MKRILFIIALALIISTSVIAGTLSIYTIKLDDLAEGSTVAKEFILEEGKTYTFGEDVRIGPGETVKWEFSLKNYKGRIVSETAMGLDFSVRIKNAPGKSAIEPLEITVSRDEDHEIMGSKTGTGTIGFTDSFNLKENGQEKVYTVLIKWPSDNEVDINYAGSDFGTTIRVSVIGTQIRELY